ncbi:helix-turn-helix domain-containing protein [Hymenobacter terrenus]|uniref:helix-turn-helix domain-containing protein n=1 Tax=Hymenobacter terrenus TaxID=1629124 RepID=UPI000619B410|nr:helix-turn-helix domain-containing protein [Hymenobacter terrenus]
MQLFAQQLPQNPLLLSYIESFFYFRATIPLGSAPVSQMFPDGKSVITINLASQYADHGQPTPTVLPQSILSAMCLNSHFIQPQAEAVDMIGIQFRSEGLYPFLSVSLHELATQIHPLELLFGSSVQELSERLFANPAPDARSALLESYLLKRLNQKRANRLINGLVPFIQQRKGGITVKQLTNLTQVSERTLERHFLHCIGVSPKRFIRVVRFQAVIQRIRQAPFEGQLTALAYEFGYTDQSHLIKEFQAFAHITPSQYLKKVSTLSEFYSYEQ